MGSEYDYQKIAGYLKEKDINNFRLVSRLHRRSSEQRFQRMRSHPRIQGYMFFPSSDNRVEFLILSTGGTQKMLGILKELTRLGYRILDENHERQFIKGLEEGWPINGQGMNQALMTVFRKDYKPNWENYYVRTRHSGAVVVSSDKATALRYMNELVDDGVVLAATRNYVSGVVYVVEA